MSPGILSLQEEFQPKDKGALTKHHRLSARASPLLKRRIHFCVFGVGGYVSFGCWRVRQRWVGRWKSAHRGWVLAGTQRVRSASILRYAGRHAVATKPEIEITEDAGDFLLPGRASWKVSKIVFFNNFGWVGRSVSKLRGVCAP